MLIEQMKDAATPEEMRAEIQRMRRYDPLACGAMELADREGMTAEDRYTVLAYHALRALIDARQRAINNAR